MTLPASRSLWLHTTGEPAASHAACTSDTSRSNAARSTAAKRRRSSSSGMLSCRASFSLVQRKLHLLGMLQTQRPDACAMHTSPRKTSYNQHGIIMLLTR